MNQHKTGTREEWLAAAREAAASRKRTDKTRAMNWHCKGSNCRG